MVPVFHKQGEKSFPAELLNLLSREGDKKSPLDTMMVVKAAIKSLLQRNCYYLVSHLRLYSSDGHDIHHINQSLQ